MGIAAAILNLRDYSISGISESWVVVCTSLAVSSNDYSRDVLSEKTMLPPTAPLSVSVAGVRQSGVHFPT